MNAPADPFAVTVDESGDAVRVAVQGVIDTATTGRLTQCIAGVLSRRQRTEIVVDLSTVRLLAAGGIRAMLAARRHAAEAGAGLYVTGAHGIVSTVLQLTGAYAELSAPVCSPHDPAPRPEGAAIVPTPRERARQALRTHAPDLADAGITELGRGLDNTAFRCGELVLRAADHDVVRREAALLAVVSAHVSLPVPAVRFADPATGVLAYPLLPGRPLLGRPAPAALAAPLGRFLRDLHAIPLSMVDGLAPVEDAEPGEWLEDLDGPAELLRMLHDTIPEPSHRRVLAHADLGAEHILERDGAVTGVIDWTDAAVTDPALDFARLYRDFGPEFLAAVLAEYGEPPARDRIEFFARCAALEDLAYGRSTDRFEYARAAERSLARLFPTLRAAPADDS
ncbi:phosphotransferase [Dactylosporangium sp. CA-139066]|uniref:phosphotransferase n=1 Tax=Dactylosporangium sp. CA-139066 TaxID=3239930 RepID=UPI003D8A067A